MSIKWVQVGPYLVRGVERETYVIRLKDLGRISGNEDARLRNIHATSEDSLAIIPYPTLHCHHVYLKLSAQTKAEIEDVKLRIEDAIPPHILKPGKALPLDL